MENTKISFIGGGNMARSLIGGLLKNGCPASNITISDPDKLNLSLILKLDPKLNTTTDNRVAASFGELIVFAVKPQIFPEVLDPLSKVFKKSRPLLLSIAAGIPIKSIDSWSGGGLAIVRCMPNTPALVESGAAGLYANNQVTKSQRTLAESLLRAVGIAVWVDHESQIDIVTALSGSGPAYHFLVMEAMQSSAEKMGLPSEAARLLSLQTAFGSAKLALESDVSFKTLRERVTSKGGTTAAALDRFSKLKLQDIFADAMQAAADRSHELSQQIGKS